MGFFGKYASKASDWLSEGGVIGSLPSIFTAGAKGSWGAAKFLSKGGIGGDLRRTAVGAAVGGLAGYAASDSNIDRYNYRDAAMGALMGASGAAFLRHAPKAAIGIGKIGKFTTPWLTKHVAGFATSKVTHAVAPYALIGGGLAYTADLASDMKQSVTGSGPLGPGYMQRVSESQYTTQDPRELMGPGVGLAPATMETQQSIRGRAQYLMNSTQGLVSGMHNGRHG